MFPASEIMPIEELNLRHARMRALLSEREPKAGGILVFSRLNIYYLTGTFGNGLLWLPLEGEPVLLIRKGVERAGLESPLRNIIAFKSYKDVVPMLKDAGSPLSAHLGAETNGLSWGLGRMLEERIPNVSFVSADRIIAMARSIKSEWELKKMRIAGARHDEALRVLLPQSISPKMTEREISHKIWKVFLSLGHQGILRMENYGEEAFLGHVAVGESANYPSVFNGPVGLMGEHPAVPHMGYAGNVWNSGNLLTCDVGFSLEGYTTDKTQVYFAGKRADIPDTAVRAHEMCIRIQDFLAENLKPGRIPSALNARAFKMAEEEGFAEGFMALGGNKVSFTGHGIGLAIDEYPVLAKGFDEPLQEGMVMALEPKIGIPGYGMAGVENTFEVTPNGGVCITGNNYEIICV